MIIRNADAGPCSTRENERDHPEARPVSYQAHDTTSSSGHLSCYVHRALHIPEKRGSRDDTACIRTAVSTTYPLLILCADHRQGVSWSDQLMGLDFVCAINGGLIYAEEKTHDSHISNVIT